MGRIKIDQSACQLLARATVQIGHLQRAFKTKHQAIFKGLALGQNPALKCGIDGLKRSQQIIKRLRLHLQRRVDLAVLRIIDGLKNIHRQSGAIQSNAELVSFKPHKSNRCEGIAQFMQSLTQRGTRFVFVCFTPDKSHQTFAGDFIGWSALQGKANEQGPCFPVGELNLRRAKPNNKAANNTDHKRSRVR